MSQRSHVHYGFEFATKLKCISEVLWHCTVGPKSADDAFCILNSEVGISEVSAIQA